MSPLPAFQFLTRLPLPFAPAGIDRIASAIGWAPAVGLVLGAIVLTVDRLAMQVLPPGAVDVLLVVSLAALTGALHLDGVADSADGLLGGRNAEQRLDIMRDTHSGSFAIVGIVSVLALKWAGFNSLPGEVRVEAILVAPCVARFSMLTAIAAFPYVRSAGAGAGFHERAMPVALPFGAATAAAVSIGLLGIGGVYVVTFAALLPLALGWCAARMLRGGLTGDVYGAIVEVGEATTLLFIAALANRGWIDALLFG